MTRCSMKSCICKRFHHHWNHQNIIELMTRRNIQYKSVEIENTQTTATTTELEHVHISHSYTHYLHQYHHNLISLATLRKIQVIFIKKSWEQALYNNLILGLPWSIILIIRKMTHSFTHHNLISLATLLKIKCNLYKMLGIGTVSL